MDESGQGSGFEPFTPKRSGDEFKAGAIIAYWVLT